MSSEANGNYCFTWKIDNFSLCLQKNRILLESPPFTAENVGNGNFHILLYTKDKGDECKEYVFLGVDRHVNNIIDDVSNADVKVEIVEANGNIIKQTEIKNGTFKTGGAMVSIKFMKIKELEQIMENLREDKLILRCTIVNRKILLSNGDTKIEADGFVFRWQVDSPDGVIHPRQKKFSMQASVFHLNLISSGDDVKLSICKKDIDKNFPKTVSCRISLLDINGDKVHLKRAVRTFESEEVNSDWEFPSFLSVPLLKKSTSFLTNGAFTLIFDFSISKNKDRIYVINPVCNNYSKNCNISGLKSDLRKLCCNDSHSDVKLKVGGKIFRAHKCILAARSDVFSVMFSQDMLETRTGIIKISDVDADVFKSFLKYMYSAEVDNMSYEIASKLMILADKYQVPMLKQHCSHVLRSQLTTENAYDVLTLADTLKYEPLKFFAVDFICEHAKEMLTSSEWGKLAEKDAKLAAELISSIAMNSEIVLRRFKFNK